MSMAMGFWLLPPLLVMAILAGDLLCVDVATAKSEVKALEHLFKSLNSPFQLTGWNASGGSLYSQLGRGTHCSRRRKTLWIRAERNNWLPTVEAFLIKDTRLE